MQLSEIARKTFSGEGVDLSEDLGGADADGRRKIAGSRCTVDHNRQGHYCPVRSKDKMGPLLTSTKRRTILANREGETWISVNDILAEV